MIARRGVVALLGAGMLLTAVIPATASATGAGAAAKKKPSITLTHVTRKCDPSILAKNGTEFGSATIKAANVSGSTQYRLSGTPPKYAYGTFYTNGYLKFKGGKGTKKLKLTGQWEAASSAPPLNKPVTVVFSLLYGNHDKTEVSKKVVVPKCS